jgi:hypothetical protein
MNSWRRWQSARATDVSVYPVSATTVAFDSPHRSSPASGLLELPGTGTGLPAAISAPAVRIYPAVRFRRGPSRSPYRSQAPSQLRDGPTVRAGLVPPTDRPARGDRECRTGRTAGGGPVGPAGRRFRAVVSRSYRPHGGCQLVPGRGWYRSHSGTGLRRSGDFGDRIITSCCSRWPSPATAEDRRAP